MNKSSIFETLQTGVFEDKLDQMAIKEGRKTFLTPGGFGPTAAGNSEEQTVYWNCISRWKLILFYWAEHALM